METPHSFRTHIERLKKYCRTCGNIISMQGRKPKDVMTYCNEIKQLFDHDIKLDDLTIFPKFICDACRKKFDVVKKSKTMITKDTLPMFETHTSECCAICFQIKREKLQGFSLVDSMPGSKMLLVTAAEYGLVNFPATQDYLYIFGFQDKTQKLPYINSFLLISKDLTWKIIVNGKALPDDHSIYTCNPNQRWLSSTEKINAVFANLTSLNFCQGNVDYPTVVKKKLQAIDGTFNDQNGEPVAYLTAQSNLVKISDLTTIRAENCHLLIAENLRCNPCTAYRRSLNVFKSRIANSSATSSKFKPDSSKSIEELKAKTKHQSKEIASLRRSLDSMRKTVQQFIEREAEKIDKPLHG